MSRRSSRRASVPSGALALVPTPLSDSSRLVEAQRLLAGGQLAAGDGLLRFEFRDDAHRAEANYLLAAAAVISRRADAALEHATTAVDAAPTVARYWFAKGRAHKAKGQVNEAVQAYLRAIELDPQYAEVHVSLGITMREAGDLDDAIACYQRAIAINPRLGVAHANLAIAIEARAEADASAPGGEAPDAALVEATARAVEMDPRNAVLHRNHGVLLFRAGQREEACTAFNRALGLDPADVEACLRLGICFRMLGQFTKATVLYEKWLERNPPSAPVMRQLSFLLTVGRPNDSLQWSQRAVALEGSAAAYHQLGNAYQQCRRLPEALAALERSLELSGYRQASYYSVLLLLLSYVHEDPLPILQRHAEYGAVLAAATPLRPRWRQRQPGRRLRVGYITADFIQHSVSYFMEPLLARHDTSRFEIFCYYNRAFGDATTQRLKAIGHHWLDCSALSDAQLAQRIRDDEVDVLVELSGHTGESRLMMLQLGAAPVQVSYLGYPTVTGSQAVDFRITDGVIDPGDIPALNSDRPLPLARSMFCFRPALAPRIEAAPQKRHGHVTFGSFNNVAKVSDHTLQLWASVLLAVPGSRLLLKTASMGQSAARDSIVSQMNSLGIASDRLCMQGQVADSAGHLALYNEVDVGLDTFPFNGATTTCEALWMGVPVVSLRGRTHTSRMGASILRAAGKPEWVTADDARFVATAVRLAADLPGREAWRLTARSELAASELFDEPGFAHCFETALEQAWHFVEQQQDRS